MPLLRLDVVPDADSPGVTKAITTANAAALVAHNERLRASQASRAPACGPTLRHQALHATAAERIEDARRRRSNEGWLAGRATNPDPCATPTPSLALGHYVLQGTSSSAPHAQHQRPRGAPRRRRTPVPGRPTGSRRQSSKNSRPVVNSDPPPTVPGSHFWLSNLIVVSASSQPTKASAPRNASLAARPHDEDA